jgi:hypothetical protein
MKRTFFSPPLAQGDVMQTWTQISQFLQRPSSRPVTARARDTVRLPDRGLWMPSNSLGMAELRFERFALPSRLTREGASKAI